jgi:polygalacturonase
MGGMEVNVIDYGAVSDGETDCIAAIQRAINAAGAPPPSDDED